MTLKVPSLLRGASGWWGEKKRKRKRQAEERRAQRISLSNTIWNSARHIFSQFVQVFAVRSSGLCSKPHNTDIFIPRVFCYISCAGFVILYMLNVSVSVPPFPSPGFHLCALYSRSTFTHSGGGILKCDRSIAPTFVFVFFARVKLLCDRSNAFDVAIARISPPGFNSVYALAMKSPSHISIGSLLNFFFK